MRSLGGVVAERLRIESELDREKDVAGMLSEFVDLRAERVAIRNALERLLSLRDRAAAPDYESVEPTNDEWLAAWDDARKALNADA